LRLVHFFLEADPCIALGYRSTALYLDATFGTEVFAAEAKGAARLPKSFPFPPNACPSANGPLEVNFGTLLNFLFSITCSGLCLFRVARVTPRFCPLASSHLYKQTTRQNLPPKAPGISPPLALAIHNAESLPAIDGPRRVPEESSLQSKCPWPPV
jgi:hypothetical protein